MEIITVNGRKMRLLSDEEDAIVTAAAMSDPDCPILTDEDWQNMRPFSETKYAKLFKEGITIKVENVDVEPRKAGRPKVENPKPRVTLRLSNENLDYLRATGKGWQTRVNELITQAIVARRI